MKKNFMKRERANLTVIRTSKYLNSVEERNKFRD